MFNNHQGLTERTAPGCFYPTPYFRPHAEQQIPASCVIILLKLKIYHIKNNINLHFIISFIRGINPF